MQTQLAALAAAVLVGCGRTSLDLPSRLGGDNCAPHCDGALPDTTPPTVPQDLVVQAISSTRLSLSWSPSSDPVVAGAVTSGVKEYLVYRDGGASVLVTAPTSPVGALVGQDIGSPSQPGSEAQSGSTYSVTSSGVGAWRKADDVRLVSTATTGDFVVTAHLTAFTGGSTGMEAGLMARDGLATDAAFVQVVSTQPGVDGDDLEWRAVAGAFCGRSPWHAGDPPVWLRLARSGALFTAWASADGVAWTTVGTTILALPPTLQVGLTLAGGDGVVGTVVFEEVRITQPATVGFTDDDLSMGQSHDYRVSARDNAGNESAQSAPVGGTTNINRAVELESSRYPRLGSSLIGGTPRAYDTAGFITWASKQQVAQLNTWDGWEASRTRTLAQTYHDIAAASPLRVPTVVVGRAETLSFQRPGAVNQADIDAAQFWLYDTFPAGAVVTATFVGAGYGTYNFTDGGPTYNGRTGLDYVTDYFLDVLVNGGALGLAQQTNAANPYGQGLVIGQIRATTPVAGDWARSGTSQAAGDAAQSQRLRDAYAHVFQRWEAGNPGAFLLGGTFSQFANAATPTAGLTGIMNGGFFDGMLGLSWSVESWSTYDNHLQSYQRQMAVLISPRLGVFEHSLMHPDGSDYYRTAPGQAVRYGLGSCLLGDAYYGTDQGTGNTSTGADCNQQLWFDEFAVDPATGVALEYPNVDAGLGYMGLPVDPPFPPAWQQGVYRRRFYNEAYSKEWWVLVNPKGNGAQTVPLGKLMQKLTGAQVPSINDGSVVGSVSLSDSDGLILMEP